MGNLPASEYGHIYLRTKDPFYIAGSLVTGEVFLDLKTVFPGNTIFLKLKGKEECEWEEWVTRWEDKPDGTRTSHQEKIIHKGHKSFYRKKFPIYVWNSDSIPPGQWVFPFSYNLEPYLPGSFEEKDHRFKAKIKYKAKVELNPHHHGKGIKHNQELVLRELIKDNMQWNVPVENSINAKTWCCINQGVCRMKCFFEKNLYCPEEIANMICEVDNSQCDLPVRTITMRLLRNIHLDGHHKKHYIQDVINSYDLPGGNIHPHESAIGENRKIAGIVLRNNSKNCPIQPSTHGSIVKCEYVLSVKTVLDGVTCCTADPEVHIPLTIFAPPLQNFNQVQAPPNWEPHVMPMYECLPNAGFDYPSQNQALQNQGPVPFQMNNPGMPQNFN